VFGTLFAGPARSEKEHYPNAQIYNSPEEANQVYWNQLRLYHQLADEKPEVYRLITTKSLLNNHLNNGKTSRLLQTEEYLPLGIVPSMEGAEGIIDSRNYLNGGRKRLALHRACMGWQSVLRRHSRTGPLPL
jgi:hypothetical protein